MARTGIWLLPYGLMGNHCHLTVEHRFVKTTNWAGICRPDQAKRRSGRLAKYRNHAPLGLSTPKSSLDSSPVSVAGDRPPGRHDSPMRKTKNAQVKVHEDVLTASAQGLQGAHHSFQTDGRFIYNSQMTSATIKLFLPRGDAKSLRTAEISNWTGKAVAAPRTEVDELLAREELDKTGVYILIGTDPFTNAARAYIGEAEIIRERLKQELKGDIVL